MNQRLLHSVIDELLCAVDRYPEIAEPVRRFVFDEGHAIREGIYVVKTPTGSDVCHADGSVSIGVHVEVLASDDLIQFAHAVANGVVPHMPLRGGAAVI
ncbi:hypothetical protein [Paraburkholderia sp. SIMBA_030]|uniref:hypothetical protein n=1 Tax=Paraburkholderia sp. SIMBA_030 TaxID=3085773 RepID=UPI00397B7833